MPGSWDHLVATIPGTQGQNSGPLTLASDNYDRGTPTTALCRQYKLSKGFGAEDLAGAGVQLRHRPMTEAQIAAAKVLYIDEGLSLSQVTERIEVPWSTVCGRCGGPAWRCGRRTAEWWSSG